MRKLMRLPEVMEVTGKSRSSIYADPDFPKPVKIGARSSAWPSSEIDDWIKQRILQR